MTHEPVTSTEPPSAHVPQSLKFFARTPQSAPYHPPFGTAIRLEKHSFSDAKTAEKRIEDIVVDHCSRHFAQVL
jgi:hypothetical protein